MSTFILLGFASSVLIGVCLGLVGGGGSMLTMPVLVYLCGISPLLSSSYSLFVVGIASAIGMIHYVRHQLVNYQTGITFAIPSIVGVYLSRFYLAEFVPGSVIMLLFAAFMLVSAYSMIADKRTVAAHGSIHYYQTALCGMAIGAVTGLVGAGGGFLIIPTLVLLMRLPMRNAVGTSLFIITIKSLLGFIGDYSRISINWYFLLSFTLFALAGITLGTWLSPRVSNQHLKKFFGWLILCIGIGIFYKELI